MYFPRLREIVNVRGYPGEFFVLAVDRVHEHVDLARLTESPCLVESVPVADLRLRGKQTPSPPQMEEAWT